MKVVNYITVTYNCPQADSSGGFAPPEGCGTEPFWIGTIHENDRPRYAVIWRREVEVQSSPKAIIPTGTIPSLVTKPGPG